MTGKRGFCVHMYEDARFAGNLQKVFETHEITLDGAAGNAVVKIDMVTSDLKEAVEDVEFIFVAVPADVYKRKGQYTLLLPPITIRRSASPHFGQGLSLIHI